jgi:hypothetical protein
MNTRRSFIATLTLSALTPWRSLASFCRPRADVVVFRDSPVSVWHSLPSGIKQITICIWTGIAGNMRWDDARNWQDGRVPKDDDTCNMQAYDCDGYFVAESELSL